ncbi:MAG: restriction endonuclease subunit S, partial [Selenomonadaceae bacterium]|nr:restriction endonuclease subunit S [Selenomonadaceae bacterium]
VLFVQKWDEKLCPYREDYPIFFATMREPSKDNSGEKILETDGDKLLRDKHGHTIVKHDLFNHDGLTRDGIAEAFIEFAKREGLSFFDSSSFDEEKYKILSEELECTEILFSYAKNDIFRLDSFFYAKEFLEGEKLISQLKTTSIREMKRATILSFGAYSLNNSVEYLSEGITFIRCVDMKSGSVNTENLIHISASAHKLLYKSEVFPETVLISMSGSIGNIAIALPSWKYPINSNQDIAKVRLRGEMNPYYFYAFFSSKYGQNYMCRESRGSVQQHVFLSQIESFRIPIPSERFSVEVEKICKAGFDCKERADEIYHAAEKMLSEELGFDKFTPSNDNIAIKSFSSSFGASGRLDAEFYQPKYEDWRNSMTIAGTVDELCKVYDETFMPKPNQIYKYIELANVLANGNISTPDKIIGADLPTRARRKVNAGQVIISSIEGSLQNCALITEENDGALCSTGFLVIDSKIFNSATLLVLFKSELMQNLMRQQCTGTILTAISKVNFADLPLPTVSKKLQEKIAAQVEESFRLRSESERLLLRAKRAVEIAVECGEDVATDFLE